MAHRTSSRSTPLNQLPLPLNVEPSFKPPKHYSPSLPHPVQGRAFTFEPEPTPLPLEENLWENEITQKIKGCRCPTCGSVDIGVIIYGPLPRREKRLNHLMSVQLLISGGGVVKPDDLYCNECSTYWVSGKSLSEKIGYTFL